MWIVFRLPGCLRILPEEPGGYMGAGWVGFMLNYAIPLIWIELRSITGKKWDIGYGGFILRILFSRLNRFRRCLMVLDGCWGSHRRGYWESSRILRESFKVEGRELLAILHQPVWNWRREFRLFSPRFFKILQDASGCFRMLQDSLRIYGHEQGGKGGREGEESLMQSLRVKLTGDIYVTVLSENG